MKIFVCSNDPMQGKLYLCMFLFSLLTVRIIMDKISKRSRGYAFIEYTTEEAASAALKEMNGKVPSF